MSIRDEIRDDIYGDGEDAAKRGETAAELADLVDDDAPPFAGRKLVAYCAVAEAIVILGILFAPRYVRGLIVIAPEAVIGSVLVPFVIGFITAFTAYRILRNDVLPSRDIPVDDGVMSGYSGYEARQRRFTIWLVAAAGGILNVLLLSLLLDIR